jgi:hypothetical protein
MDFAFLLLYRDLKRVHHVEAQMKVNPYFRIIRAVDASENWQAVEDVFIKNQIQITGNKMDFEKVGKFGRWASFIQWLSWLESNSSVLFGVLAEDDTLLSGTFREDLEIFIRENPELWFFRCGPYNSCLVVKQTKARTVLDLIRKTGITMSDDWWSWKEVQILQQGPIHLVKQNTKLKSNIIFSPTYRRVIRNKNPLIWNIID